jgi:DNA-binding MarR family transcriptional regulator
MGGMNEPRWLSEREQSVWRRYLTANRVLTEEIERQLQHEAGMPHAYYEVLVRLSDAPGRTLRMSELAERCSSSRSRLSHAVARMEDSGWISRTDCPSDKRGQNAALTEKGFEVLVDAARGHVAVVRRVLFDSLTEEQVDQLGAISSAILDGPVCQSAAANPCPEAMVDAVREAMQDDPR